MRWIGLVDCNNFFVSCERLFRPDLRTRPAIVLSSNDGCIVARSAEVKAIGIPMGVPYFKVKKELEAVGTAVFSSNFPLYRDISARVMQVLRQEIDVVEQYSVDEAFFTLDCDQSQAVSQAAHLKQTVERLVGVPVTVGLARTKTIAKAASEIGKKGTGVAVLTGRDWKQYATTLPIGEIWGIGGKTSQKMRALDILTVADFLVCDRARIQKLFGIEGLRKHDELSEIPVYLVGQRQELQKSLISSRSFKSTTSKFSVLRDAVSYHIAHVAEELREKRAVAQGLSVSIRPSRHGDWVLRGGSQSVVLTQPTNDTFELLKVALILLSDLYDPEVPYKKVGVGLSLLSPEEYSQANLFSEPAGNDVKLLQTIDSINQKYGQGGVQFGRVATAQEWQPRRDQISPAYTTQWSDIATINA